MPGGYHDVRLYFANLRRPPATWYYIASLPSPVAKRFLVWTISACSIALADCLLLAQPAGIRMIVIIVVLLYTMKSVVYMECLIRDPRKLPLLRWIAFHCWIGMRPYVFAKRKDKPYDGGKLIRLGFVRLLIGIGMVTLSWLTWHWAAQWDWNPIVGRICASGFLLAGLSLIGHFGLLNIGAGLWRKAGFDCQPLFRNPFQSRSLNEFWSRRWNLAFSEMTSLGVYRPLAGLIGKNSAAFASFLFSGILHELAISLPVRQGYGMPLLYFFIHGCGIVIEHLLEKRGCPISKVPWVGRLWTIVWLVVPLPILFHPAFLKGIVWPIVGIY
ncbi:wax synthase family protein [Cohnella terricola]|uniref:Membrane bound O-acyl transferase family-domain-containing protein n=1 Tax=Cohnella terricola TaxID=1289167 RepID=A0A559JWB0_9BACL|nr:membrane bound O-acyl transferase family-domain-containing protein [Cohnella terricola]TVY04182.1 membrane bound O-acyl transferase family-domain-containing protein [Cohnella terricola]